METKHALIIAAAIVVGFVAHGLINWGPYQISSGDNLLYRVNQRTGEIHGFASSSDKSEERGIARIQIYPMGDNNSTLPRD